MNRIDLTHDIMNGLDPALIEQTSHGKRKTSRRPIRTVLVAACLCAVLVGAAMATGELLRSSDIQKYFSGSQFSDVMKDLDRTYQIIPGNEDHYSGYVIPWEGHGVSLENTSEELQDLLRECTESGDVATIRFGTTTEMQRFIGFSLYENPVLDQLEQRALAENQADAVYDEDGNLPVSDNEVVGAVLRCGSYGNGLNRLDLLSFYGLNNGALEITVTAEVVGYDLESNGTAFVFTDGTRFSTESYATASGDKISIVRCDVPQRDGNAAYTQYSAHFHVSGVRYHVSILCLENPEEYSQLMKEILDAFVFHHIS